MTQISSQPVSLRSRTGSCRRRVTSHRRRPAPTGRFDLTAPPSHRRACARACANARPVGLRR